MDKERAVLVSLMGDFKNLHVIGHRHQTPDCCGEATREKQCTVYFFISIKCLRSKR